MIVVSGTMKINTSKRLNFIESAKHVAIETRKEPGCLKYVVGADLEDESLFYVFEEWEDHKALQAHFSTPHMTMYSQKIGDVIIREGTKFQIYNVESVQPMRR